MDTGRAARMKMPELDPEGLLVTLRPISGSLHYIHVKMFLQGTYKYVPCTSHATYTYTGRVLFP